MMANTEDEWKRTGNEQFVAKKYREALYSYSQGLSINPNNVDILTNRALVYINLRRFHLSLKDSEAAVQINPEANKAIYRKGKSLIELGRYDEAVNFLKGNNNNENKNLENKTELLRLEKEATDLLNQSKTGIFDMPTIMKNGNYQNCANYTGPVKVVKIEGKGRGLIATKDIKAGQLLIACKPLEIVFYENTDPISSVTNSMNKLQLLKNQSKIVNELINHAKEEPEILEELYQLYDGSDSDLPLELNKENLTVDENRIFKIYTFNGFQNEGEITDNKKSSGLWILPSFINHSCFGCNSRFRIYGDLMTIRCFKPIPKGKEILLTYVNVEKSLQQRQVQLKIKFQFDCSCLVCQAEKNESPQVKKEFDKYFKEAEDAINSGKLDVAEKKIDSIKQMKFFKDNSMLKISRLQTLEYNLAKNYYMAGNYQKSVNISINLYNCVKDTVYNFYTMDYAMNISFSFVSLGQMTKAQQWINEFKKSVEVYYGTIEGYKFLEGGQYFVDNLKVGGFKF